MSVPPLLSRPWRRWFVSLPMALLALTATSCSETPASKPAEAAAPAKEVVSAPAPEVDPATPSSDTLRQPPKDLRTVETMPPTVEQLPRDKFDSYPAGEQPPAPWQVSGTGQPGVSLALEQLGESPFVGNTVTGKGVMVHDSSPSDGEGAGFRQAFAPPPPGNVFLGFDFRLGESAEHPGNVDLAARLTDAYGEGLLLTASLAEGLHIRTADGQEKQMVRSLFPATWYRLIVTISAEHEATLALRSELDRETVIPLGTVTLPSSEPYTRLQFVSSGGDARQGAWAVDNIVMAGRVEAPRTAWLPFRQESVQDMRASNRKVYAYYYPIYSSGESAGDPGLSWYSRTTLNPTVKVDPKREQAGTKLFYYPLPRPPLPGNFEDREERARLRIPAMENEIRIARQMGLDGFVLDFFGFATNKGGQKHFNEVSFSLLDAAAQFDPDFKIIPAVYSNAPGKNVAEHDANRTPEEYASSPVFERLAKSPAVFRTPDGRMLLTMWLTENHSAAWWQKVIAALEAKGMPVALMTEFNSRTHLDEFAPIAYAMSHWGPRSPIKTGWVEQARKYPPIVVAPIASHDIRSRGCGFWESSNFDTLRSTWNMAISEHADWAILNTWSDYSEQAMAPSTSIGYALADLNTYYAQWFKTGQQPEIVRDILYYSYRINHSDVPPNRGKTWNVHKEGEYTQALNNVELLGFLKEPGVLTIRIGDEVFRQEAPAGITSFKVPLPPGKSFVPQFGLERDGKPVVEAEGAYTVLDRVEYPNMLYHSGVLAPPQATGSVRTTSLP